MAVLIVKRAMCVFFLNGCEFSSLAIFGDIAGAAGGDEQLEGPQIRRGKGWRTGKYEK
jgi:hypothetical protein